MKTLKDFNNQVSLLNERIEKMLQRLTELEEQYEEHIKELHKKHSKKQGDKLNTRNKWIKR